MKLWSVLALGLGLVAGAVRPTSAQQPLQRGPAAPLCDAPTAVAGTPAEHAIVATVTHVDPGQGQLAFTTATGSFVLTTSAVIDDLRVGDQVLICLHEEGRDGKIHVAEDGSAATPRTREALPHQPDTTLDPRTMPLAAGREPTRR
jgi:hypothetical protein